MTEAVPQLRSNATALLDWRRQVAAMYAVIRSQSDVRAAHRYWQDERNRLLGSHPQSPIPLERRRGFSGVPVADYDPSFRFTVPVDNHVAPARIEMQSGTDGLVPFERAGVAHLPGVGDLDVWWLVSYGGGIFVPIKDAGADGATYPGGRYLIDTVKGADLGGSDGTLVMDLNFAYNPSCAYDPDWACPLAPPGNTVRVPVTAGELMPG
ncbi:MAG TPA: DUF1684 domain-containing protein [Streptosporangiaceae bacterium]|nr:DUF1684 domain-containing protein [Streptosporangiaceae bacterium]